MAKNRPFLLVLLLGLCGTVAHDREGLELHLRCLCLEKRLLYWDKLDSTLKLLSFCCYRSISAQLSRFLAIFLANLRLATPDNRMQTITRSARTDIWLT